MTSEAMKLPVLANDGFDEIEIRGDQVIIGTKLTCVDGIWTPSINTSLLALATRKVLQFWQGRQAIDTAQPEPGNSLERLCAQLNEKIPEADWEIGIGDKPRPPWAVSHVVYLLDQRTAERFTFANSTIGAMRAVSELKDKVAWMRALRGHKVVAEVKLASKPMPTQYGQKQRPDFQILRWHELHDAGNEATPPQIEGTTAQPGLKPVAPVSSEEC